MAFTAPASRRGVSRRIGAAVLIMTHARARDRTKRGRGARDAAREARRRYANRTTQISPTTRQ